MNMSNPLDASLWLIAKMCVRLFASAILAKVAGSTIPPSKLKKELVLFRVECGEYSLTFTTSDLVQSRSRSPRKGSSTGGPASTSTVTTSSATAAPPAAASSLLDMFESGSLGQGLEP